MASLHHVSIKHYSKKYLLVPFEIGMSSMENIEKETFHTRIFPLQSPSSNAIGFQLVLAV